MSLVTICAARGKLPAPGEAPAAHKTILEKQIQKLNVPHSWFTHFYVVGSLWTSFWLIIILQCDPHQTSDVQNIAGQDVTVSHSNDPKPNKP
eukprot:1185614-Prorocentrum_minimum.AAC.4